MGQVKEYSIVHQNIKRAIEELQYAQIDCLNLNIARMKEHIKNAKNHLEDV